MADKAAQFKAQNAQEEKVEMREVDGKKEYLDADTNEWVSKGELKKRQTQKKKAKDAAEKAAKKAADPKTVKKEKAANDDELDPSKYTEIRRKFLQDLRDNGKNPYPHKFNRDMTIPQFRKDYEEQKIAENTFLEDKKVALTGRIHNLRASGNKLIFIDLTEDNSKVQIFATAANYTGDFDFLGKTLKRGDIIGVEGCPGRTKTGELSVRPTMITPLSYCLHQLPKQKEGENVMNKDTRYRQRYLDLIMNNSVINKFTTRNKITSFVRDYLRNMDFVEVETPMMNMIPGGATARPFETYHNELDMKLYMRIAPELYLKMLIVGGMNRVFEIGKNFRNEGIDMTHNPEFTTCEFYMAYADYNDLMDMTEDMLSKMVYAIHGKYEIDYHPDGPESDKVIKINFAKPFKRIPMMKGLEEALKVKMPKNTDLHLESSREFFDKLCKQHDIKCSAPRTTARLIDKLVGEFIETGCKDPTFITDTPQLMSPLAKWHRSEPGLSERFELFANYHEIINAYTELNDPKVQLEAFQGQASAKDAGDLEAQHVDQSFVTALEYGLPPTGGWGMGIDRITMLLTDSNNIKEVMLFPAMKPNEAGAKEDGPKGEAPGGDAGKNTLFLTENTQLLPKIVNEMCGSNKAEVKNVKAADYKANKDFQAKNPSMAFPCVETSTGAIVSQDSAVASHLARKCPGLLGENAMQEAQVNQWLAWTETNSGLMDFCVKAIQGHVKDVDQKVFTAKVGEVKALAKTVNSALKGKTTLVGSKTTLADLAVGAFFTPAFSLFLDAGFQKPMADLTNWYKAFTALPAVVASAGHIKCCVKSLKPPTEGGAAKKEAPKKAAKKDDDMDDLFGDDSEDDGAAAAAAAAAKAKAQAGKKPKKVVVAQSLVLFEVKPLDDTTDIDQMAKDILAIKMDGLYWKTEYKKEPVAFGIFKIIIGVTVEDEKVSVDGLQEKIEALEDKVQSVEILAFNKI